MSRRGSMTLMLILTVCYGVAIAVMAVLDAPFIGTVAVVGALVLAVLWAVRGRMLGGERAD